MHPHTPTCPSTPQVKHCPTCRYCQSQGLLSFVSEACLIKTSVYVYLFSKYERSFKNRHVSQMAFPMTALRHTPTPPSWESGPRWPSRQRGILASRPGAHHSPHHAPWPHFLSCGAKCSVLWEAETTEACLLSSGGPTSRCGAGQCPRLSPSFWCWLAQLSALLVL